MIFTQVTSKFELYTCFSPLVTKACAITVITKLLRWIKKEEERLFIRYPPKYSTTPNPAKSSRGAKAEQTDSSDNGFLSLLWGHPTKATFWHSPARDTKAEVGTPCNFSAGSSCGQSYLSGFTLVLSNSWMYHAGDFFTRIMQAKMDKSERPCNKTSER